MWQQLRYVRKSLKRKQLHLLCHTCPPVPAPRDSIFWKFQFMFFLQTPNHKLIPPFLNYHR